MARYRLVISNILKIILLSMLLSCSSGAGGGGVGQVGSTARFAIAGDFLYVLTETVYGQNEPESQSRILRQPIIRSFDISNSSRPTPGSDTPVIAHAETLFVNRDKLFVGAQIGMEIYDLSVPGQPNALSRLDHFRACDPVVTEGDTAYVTLHGSPLCPGDVNVLKIIDIADTKQPKVITTFPMNAPFGLAVREGVAYICDGPVGLRILDVRSPSEIRDLPGVPEEICVDMILRDDRLITTGFAGINQYDVKTSPPKKLSTIQVGGSNS